MNTVCEVTVIGDLLLDILLYIDRETKIDDLSHVVKRASISPGGVGGNISTAISRLGLPTCLVSAIGGDAIGRYLLEDLRGENVNTKHVKIFRNRGTGVTIALVKPGGSRTLLSYRGACEEQYIDLDALAETLKGSKLLFISGYLLHSPWGGEAMVRSVELASRLEVEVGADLHGVGRERQEIFERLGGKISYIFLNEEELRRLSGEHSLDRAVEKLGEMPRPKEIFVKRGEKGSIINYPDKLVNIPPYRVRAVNTTRCGDAFNAGISLEEAARLGNMMRAYKATGPGPRHLPKSLEELNSFFAKPKKTGCQQLQNGTNIESLSIL